MRSLVQTDNSLRGRPWGNRLLILANIAVYLLQNRRVMDRFSLNEQTLELRAFVTYAFLHINLAHLVFNLLFLWLMGRDVNMRLGNLGYVAFYLAGAVVAALGFLASGGRAVVGASGAVGAVMGAYLVFFPRSRISIVLGKVVLEVPAMLFVVFYFLFNVAMSLAPTEAQQVAYQAHIAGILFGFVVTLGLLASGLAARQPFDFLSLGSRWRRRRDYKRLVQGGYDPFAYAREPKRAEPQVDRPDALSFQIATVRAQVSEAVAQRNLAAAAEGFRYLRSLDPKQCLPRQAQIDVANQLASEQRYIEAAGAYEQFLEHYPNFEQIEEVQLMLGLIYARYLSRYARARECLTAALARLQGERQIELATAELRKVEEMVLKK